MTEMGRLVGNSVMEFAFRCLYGNEVQLGEIVVAQDEERTLYCFVPGQQAALAGN